MANRRNTEQKAGGGSNFSLAKEYDKLLFIPLGGCDEIGLNMNLYHYQGKWIMADCGAGFAGVDMPGVDILVPDISFIIKNKIELEAIIITHIHEDHLGALLYLFQYLPFPVYCTALAASVAQEKLSDFPEVRSMGFRPIIMESNKKIHLGPFTITPVGITHSVPEMNGLYIETPGGTVFHTGDWKLDPDPIVGAATDTSILKQIGDRGVDALVNDSTNIMSTGWSHSEGELRESMYDLIGKAKGMVAVSTFASNIARVETIAYAAKKAGRHIGTAGFSMNRIITAARRVGYLQDYDFLSPEELANMPRNKSLLICTGCQGEENAAINKIASGIHRNIKLHHGDTVIFSSKIIPGNERRIFNLLNKFALHNIDVITEREKFVHVSGHPNQGEVAEMYRLLRPTTVIPVHGEPVHIQTQCEFAISHGHRSMRPSNGDVIEITKEKCEIIGSVFASNLGIDGYRLVHHDSEVIKTRKIIADHGSLFCYMVINKRGAIVSTPEVVAPGLFDISNDKYIVKDLQKELCYKAQDILSGVNRKGGKEDVNMLENYLRQFLIQFVQKQVNKKPHVVVRVVEI